MTVEAGCVLANIQQAAADADRLFPLSLGAEGSCQIGGNLSTNAGGVNVLRYGNTRDLVLGIEAVLPDGTLGASLQCIAYDSSIYTISNIQQYTPTPNSNLANPNNFGTIPAPTIGTLNQTAPVPFFNVTPTASSQGIIEYAEVWYSAYASPTPAQLIFYGTTTVLSNGSSRTRTRATRSSGIESD